MPARTFWTPSISTSDAGNSAFVPLIWRSLQNMGFTNKEAVQLALRNHAGSVENAVCELTRQQDQQHETTSVPLLSHSTRQQRRRQRKQKMGKIKKNNMPGLVLLV